MPYGHATRTEFGVRSMPYGHATRTEFGVRSTRYFLRKRYANARSYVTEYALRTRNALSVQLTVIIYTVPMRSRGQKRNTA